MQRAQHSTPGNRTNQATYCTVWRSAAGLSVNVASTVCERVLVCLLVIVAEATEGKGVVNPVSTKSVHQEQYG